MGEEIINKQYGDRIEDLFGPEKILSEIENGSPWKHVVAKLKGFEEQTHESIYRFRKKLTPIIKDEVAKHPDLNADFIQLRQEYERYIVTLVTSMMEPLELNPLDIVGEENIDRLLNAATLPQQTKEKNILQGAQRNLGNSATITLESHVKKFIARQRTR